MAGALALGEHLAGCVVALMFAGGNVLEEFAERRATRELSALLAGVPRKAQRERDGGLEEVPVEAIRPGDRLLVPQGGIVPVDGADPADTGAVRLDIDTDLRTTRALWQVMCEMKVRGSFYFRLSTLDVGLMQEIHAAGSEASYHYEEVATYAKRHRLKSRAEVEARMPAIRALFAENYRRVKALTGLPLHTVASHGDWINRRLGITNLELLQDPSLREALGIELEAYDQALHRHYARRYSDGAYPSLWLDGDPLEALENRLSVVEILMHLRHWAANVPVNLRDNIQRIGEELLYRSLPAR